MTVRSKTLLITVATLAALIALVCLISVLILMDDCGRHEADLVKQDMTRARTALAYEISNLENIAGDYAAREDSYAFMENTGGEYKKNFSDEAMAGRKLSFAGLYRPPADLVYAKGFNLNEEVEAPFPDALRSGLGAGDVLLSHADGKRSTGGMLVLDGQVYLVASRPIIPNESKGPIRGTLILGRVLDKYEMDELSGPMLLSLRGYPLGGQLPSDFAEARAALSKPGVPWIRPLTADSIAGYQLMGDVHGKPAFILRSDTPRLYRRQFMASLRYFIYSSVAVAFALGGISLFVTEKTLLGRLGRLSRFIKGVRTDRNLSSRLDVPGGDELSDLADAMNGMLGAIESDTAERARAQTALAESEAKYRELVENANSIILRTDTAGSITFFNEFAQRFFGWPKDEILGKNIAGTIAPTQKSPGRAGEYGTSEQENVRRDGTRVWVSWTHRPMLGPSGETVGILLVGTDITDRRKAEDALARERNLLRTLIDLIPDSIYVKDLMGRKILANVADAGSMKLESPEDAIGKTDFDAYPRELAARFHADDEMVIETGQPLVNREEPLPKGFPQRYVLTTKVPLRDAAGRIVGLVGIGRDITDRRNAENALARERNLLRTVIDALPDGVYAKDREGRKILTNPVDLKVMGAQSEEEVIGKTDFDFYPRDMAAEWQAIEERVIGTGQPFTGEGHPFRMPDSSLRFFQGTKVPLKDAEGKVVGCVGVTRDLTDLKDAMDSLRESERRYRTLFTSMTTASSLAEIICDSSGRPCDYRFIDVNPAWEKMIGFSKDQAIGKTFTDLHGKIDPGWVEIFGEVAVSGKGIYFERYSPAFDKYFEVCAYSPKKGQFASLFTDVTRRHRAEEEVRNLRAQIEFILGATKTGVDIVDSQFNVRYIDPEWQKVYGDPAGRKCYDYFMGETAPCPSCPVLTALKTKKPVVSEMTLPKENGRPILVTSVPYQDGNGEWIVAEVSVDVTDRKRLEEQLLQAQKMEAIGQLAGGIAHDFNNLLTGILGYANMLKLESATGTPVHDAAATIERAADRASQLTKQLLGFARRGKYLRVPVDVNSIAQEVTRLLERTIDKSIVITRRFAVRTPWVSGDPDQVQQAILNLAVNARDAMPEGGELTIAAQAVIVDEEYARGIRDASPGRYAKISVIDTGVGISEEARQHMFEPFFTTKKAGQGTGMGLAMVYGIVKNHNGFIRVYSEVGHGSRFDVYLPLADISGPVPIPDAGPPEKGTGRILLIDDEDVVRDVAADMLRSLGYEVATATNGDEAVQYCRDHPNEVDLAIIDLVMPGMGARECFHALRQVNPKLRAVLSSGYGLNGRAQETVDDGMLGFVQKPYTMAELSAVVRTAMRQ